MELDDFTRGIFTDSDRYRRLPSNGASFPRERESLKDDESWSPPLASCRDRFSLTKNVSNAVHFIISKALLSLEEGETFKQEFPDTLQSPHFSRLHWWYCYVNIHEERRNSPLLTIIIRIFLIFFNQPTEFRDILTSNETRDREKEKKREKENVKLFLLSSPLFTRFLHDVLKKKKKKEEKVCVTTKFSFIFGQSREERSSQFYSSRHDSGCSVFFSPSWIKRRFVFEM